MILITVPFIALIIGATNAYEILNDHEAMMYLNRFGYINDQDVPENDDMNMMKPMLMEFQKMCGINKTGILDSKTMEMMNAPRCGNLDINQTEAHTMFMNELGGGEADLDENELEIMKERYRRFSINDNGFKWKKRELTYKMGMFSKTMAFHVTKDTVLEQLHEAFKMWSSVTNLDFIYRPGNKKVDIEISFTMRFHMQDQFPFDGPGKTLAHAFPPGDGVLGDVHFEDEENWTVGTPKGINVLFVAVHEIGHALGLTHSSVKGAIMQPFYGGYSPKLQLHEDDIAGIQSMYGKREERGTPTNDDKDKSKPQTTTTTTTRKPTPPPPPPKTTPKPTKTTKKPLMKPAPPRTTTEKMFSDGNGSEFEIERPDLCKDSTLDAITTLKDGSIVAFKQNYVFKIDEKGSGFHPGWPHRIEAVFKGLEGNLDAAMTRKNGKTYFFKGQYYWRFSSTDMDAGYPKRISVHFRGIPDNIDSAFEWLDAIYFTKGDKIWRFDPKSRPFVSDIYPISLNVWHLGRNVPRVDASFTAPNGQIYFFYDQVFWRFDEKQFQVNDKASPPYPRSSKMFWFGCRGRAPVQDYREIRQSSSALFYPTKQSLIYLNDYDY